jgi:23S rRNA (uracil1939-C5)-methyltransferase
MAYGGEAVARLDGRVVFVAGALPGEQVEAEVFEERRSFWRARTVQVLQAAPARVEPPCPIFGVCGGCQWQHAAYEAQLAFKRHILQEQLERLGGLRGVTVHPTIPLGTDEHRPSPAPDGPWYYRNAARLAVLPNGSLGYRRAYSHDLVAAARCWIVRPVIDEALALLAGVFGRQPAHIREAVEQVTLRAGFAGEDECLDVLLLRRAGSSAELEQLARAIVQDIPHVAVVYEGPAPAGARSRRGEGERLPVPGPHESPAPGGRLRRLAGELTTEQMVLGQRFLAPPGSFFQVQREQAATLVRLVLDWLAPQPDDFALDAYCGVGLFTLFLAPRVQGVWGIEADAEAVQAAGENLARAGMLNAMFTTGKVEEVLPLAMQQEPPPRLDIAVLDPPRAGCAVRFLDALAAAGPRRIAYVSCEPSTLARDLRYLQERGYRTVAVWPVDMFPQTYHIEAVAGLERAG